MSRSSVDLRDGPTGAFLPRRVGCRVHDDLAYDAPAGVVGLAAADEKAGQRLGDHGGSGLGAVHVQVAQRLADAAAALHGPGELVRCAAGREFTWLHSGDGSLRFAVRWSVEQNPVPV